MPLDNILNDFKFNKNITDLEKEKFLVRYDYKGKSNIYGLRRVNNTGRPTDNIIAISKDFKYPDDILSIIEILVYNI